MIRATWTDEAPVHRDPAVGALCPACRSLAPAAGDRYCEGCGSAYDRSAWANALPAAGDELDLRALWGDR